MNRKCKKWLKASLETLQMPHGELKEEKEKDGALYFLYEKGWT